MEMTPKERVRLAFNHQKPDRVPINYIANAGIDLRMKQHYGLSPTDDDGLLSALGVDFRGVNAPYTGPPIHAPLPERDIDIWGIHRRWVEHGSGGYWDYCDFPLRDADYETVRSWPFPNPDDFDYHAVRKACQRYPDYAIVAGSAGVGDIINSTGMVRGMEQVLIDLLTSDRTGLLYVDRKMEVMLEVIERSLAAGGGQIDILNIGEDLGTQLGPMISMKVFRREIKPRLQKYIDVARSFKIPVMFHSCGSSSWVFPELMEIGVSIIDTLQPEAVAMQPQYLKQTFGDQLNFHGCITTGGAVAFGSVEETIQVAKDTLTIMMPGGGYAFAPSHALQDNSPTANVVALFETARKYGQYS